MCESAKTAIAEGRTSIGIELGSTRIKAVLVDERCHPLASGFHDWENRFEDGVFTYSMEDIEKGIQSCFADLAAEVSVKYDEPLTTTGAIGVSAMMHGYLAFDKEGNLLAPFRTWRNTMTEEASEKLTGLFNYPIPQRWSIAHLYQSILNQEEHVGKLDFLATLAVFIHWKLTGEKVAGIGEASGMFPVDPANGDYYQDMVDTFDDLIAPCGYKWKLGGILPKVLRAGESAGCLTEEGARFLDPTGKLKAGIPLCPPEGDAGTGMTATNAVRERTGNVSAGTSVFSMVVLEKELSEVHPEIDLVTTPEGSLVAMVHCNNCTSDINAWVGLFQQTLEEAGCLTNKQDLFRTLFTAALKGDPDCGGIYEYNFFGGEPVAGANDGGRPMLVRTPDAKFNLPNFMRAQLYGALATLKLGNDILHKEQVKVDKIMGHGGFFKTPLVGQQILADALKAPVSVMETAGEGGPWGMAILAEYMKYCRSCDASGSAAERLADYLDSHVFAGQKSETVEPDPKGAAGFDKYMEGFRRGLTAQKTAALTI